MNCSCGGTLYKCNSCGATWCSHRNCPNGNPPSKAINKCPRCSGYGSTGNR